MTNRDLAIEGYMLLFRSFERILDTIQEVIWLAEKQELTVLREDQTLDEIKNSKTLVR